jgi:hypothetical protein
MTKSQPEKKEERVIVDIDGNIKEALDEFFEDWVEFFLPKMHPHIDFTQKPIPLQQEKTL